MRKIREACWHIVEPWKPDAFLVTCWKIFILTCILLQGLFSTYIVSFLPEHSINFRNNIFILDFTGDMIYLLEILSLFQIGYYYHGELHTRRSDIVNHYLRTNFAWDMLSLLSLFGRIFYWTKYRYLLLLSVIRLYKIKSLIAGIEDYFQFSKEGSSVIRVIRLTGLVCVLAHFFACMLYVLTFWEADDNNWLQRSGIAYQSEREIYVASLYWSVTIMATVGFGDIIPVTLAERAFAVVLMILSSIIFGYILSTIGTLLLELSTFSTEAREKIRVLTKYMTDKGLQKNTQSKIRKYLEFYLDRENAARIEGDTLMGMLSRKLQEEVVREVNAKILSDSHIFSSNFRRKFLHLVSKDLVEKSFGPDETIFYVRKNLFYLIDFLVEKR